MVTGPYQAYGTQKRVGQQLAIEHINEDGGVLGRLLELRIEDDQSETVQAVAAARKLAGDPNIPAMTACGTYAVKALNPILDELKIVTVNPCSGAALGADWEWNQWHFRINMVETKSVVVDVLKAIMAKTGATTIAVIEDTANAYAVGIAKTVKEAVPEVGLDLVGWETYTAGQMDFSSHLSKLQRANPDILWVTSATDEIPLVIMQAQERGFNPVFVGGATMANPAHFEVSRGATAGVISYFPFSALDPRPMVQRFVKDIKEITGVEPTPFNATGYDSIVVIVEAIKKAGSTDREAIAAAMRQLQGVEGIASFYTFDGPGDNQTPMVHINVLDDEGLWKPYE